MLEGRLKGEEGCEEATHGELGDLAFAVDEGLERGVPCPSFREVPRYQYSY